MQYFTYDLSRIETAEIVARQVSDTVAESRTWFYFLQGFHATSRFAAQSHWPIAKCERLCDLSCNLSRNALQNKLHETLQYDSGMKSEEREFHFSPVFLRPFIMFMN